MVKQVLSLGLLLTLACLSPQKEPKGDMIQSTPKSAPPLCTTIQCLSRHEGKIIHAEGKFVFPRELAFAVNKLSLSDGTLIRLSPPKNELLNHFSSANDGLVMKIRGRIFIKEIPERYKIIGRTADPYLVDIDEITVTQSR